jgi:stage III sporulation protein SpoIIIAA
MKHRTEQESQDFIAQRVAAIKACDEQLEAILNHCPNVTITETIITEEDRQSISIIFSNVIDKGGSI